MKIDIPADGLIWMIGAGRKTGGVNRGGIERLNRYSDHQISGGYQAVRVSGSEGLSRHERDHTARRMVRAYCG